MSQRRTAARGSKSAQGGNVAPPPPNSPGPAIQGSFQRINRMALKDMDADQCLEFIAHHVPYIKTFQTSWRIAGVLFAQCLPSVFEQQLRSELPFIPRSAVIEMFRAFQTKINQDFNATKDLDAPSISAEIATAWANAQVPAAVVPFMPSAADLNSINDSHGGGAVQNLQGSNVAQNNPPSGSDVQPRIPPPPPVIGNHGGGANMFTPPPQKSARKFAFGAPTPMSLQQQLFSSPFHPSAGPALFNQSMSAVGPALHGQSAAIRPAPPGQSDRPAPPGQSYGPAPPGQSNSGPALPSQSNPSSDLNPLGSHPLQQVHFDHSGKFFFPWEVEALSRPAKPVDPDMMPGFKRLSISSLIDKAKQIRIANKDTVAPPTHFDKVNYPVMKHFAVEDFLSTRQAYYVAIRKSTASCLFTDFKFCMSESCRTACMRHFSLDDEQYLEIEDAKLLSWLGIFFGPKNKSDAIDRLEKIRFPNHRDDTDSQADFVNKLSDCAYEFEMSINDIANTHRSWSSDRTALTSGELTLKEVMEIWRRKFAKQETSVFSVQIRDCRVFMDRDKDSLFNDIVLKLTNHFAKVDEQVRQGTIAYTTQPSRKSWHTRSSASPNTNPVGGGYGGGGGGGGGGGDGGSGGGNKGNGYPLNPRRGSDYQGKRPAAAVDKNTKRPNTRQKIILGKDRCIHCGSNTNHWGLGPSVCAAKGTSHDANKKGHVWKDSDKEKAVIIPNNEYAQILKSNPTIALKQAEAKDAWMKQRHQSRISALAAGQSISSSDEEDDNIDSDDAAAFADELQNSDNDAVNEEQCAVSAISAAHCSKGSHIVAEENLPQFFGVVQIIDDQNHEHLAKALIDPGGTLNIISPKFRDLCSLETLKVNIKFFQGDTYQRTAKELSRCRFALKHNGFGYVNHVEWFAVADMGYDVLLGRKFSKEHGFTRFEELLVPWNDNHVQCDPVTAVIDASSATVDPNPNFQFMIKFDRVKAPEGDAKYKRKPKSLRCLMPSSSSTNIINPSSLSASNPLSNLLVVQSETVNGRERKLLQFTLLGHQDTQPTVQDWFDIEETVPNGYVVLSSQLLDKLNANVVGRRYRAPTASISSQVSALSAPQSADAKPPTSDRTSEAESRYVKSLHVTRQAHQQTKTYRERAFTPTTTDNLAIARFTTADSLTRHTVPAFVDKLAAHNVVGRHVLAIHPKTIKIFR